MNGGGRNVRAAGASRAAIPPAPGAAGRVAAGGAIPYPPRMTLPTESAAATAATPATPAQPERRANARLRELIDEMLASVRVAVNRDLWTPGEREAAELDLARLMESVRREAVAPARAPTS